MKILCSKCGEAFTSVIIDQDIAFKEVLVASMKHCRHKHKEQFELVGKAIAVGMANLTNFMHIDEFCVIPEDEEIIQGKVESMIETVMLGVGYDPQEDEEGEDEDLYTEEVVEELDPPDEVPEVEVPH